MSPRLKLSNVSKGFGSVPVVRDVSLEVSAGEVTCLLGPSGCGKSTTLRIIAGVETPDAGEIFVDGTTVSSENLSVPPEERSIGLMFQDFALFPHLSVSKNVAFGLKDDKAAVQARVNELLDRVGLGSYADKYPHELSGGEQQRVALARALAPKPKVMLMDEPFSGLDNRLRDGIRDETLSVLKEEGTAVLLVTHEPDEAMRMADEIALMRGGQIVQLGNPYNLYNSPVDKAAAAFFSDINVISGQSNGALTQTPFGHFLTPGHDDGASVEIVIRPQHLGIDFERGDRGSGTNSLGETPARGTVVRSRFMGRESLVEFKMDADGSILTATVPAVFLPKPGRPLWLTMRRERCFVFPA
ncbi:MAG: ABC transporter ATP-binding protein [Litoreibacter sp.]